jgi:raffinose/stachyose/melibiose transport system permease protein
LPAEAIMTPKRPSPYPYWFVLPAAVVFVTLFLVPTIASLWFSMTRWDLIEAHFIGWDNYHQFFKEPFLVQGLVNTLIYAGVTSASKSVLGLLLAVLLTSGILWQGFLRSVVFFPVLVSTIGVGITFQALMHPTKGVINLGLAAIGIDGPSWLSDPGLALYSVAFIDLYRRTGGHFPRLLRGLADRRRDAGAAVLAHHRALGAPGHRNGRHPVADRRFAQL